MFGAVVARALLGEGVEIHLIERCPDVLSSWNDARGHHLHRRVLVGHQTRLRTQSTGTGRSSVACSCGAFAQWKGLHGNGQCRVVRTRTATAGRLRHTAQSAWDTSERLSIGRRWNTLYFPIN